jgi:ABC-type nitrate/sulfonate/bicarbonate transport system substrate-binding protein
MRNHSLILTLQISVVAGFLAISCNHSSPGSQSAGKTKLKVTILPYLGFAPLFIASDEGYFARQGLEIELVKITRSEQGIPALDKGDLDVLGAVLSAGVFNAIARGSGIRITADRGHLEAGRCDFTAMLARRALVEVGAVRSPTSMRGRNFAVTRTSFESYYLYRLLSTAGIAAAEINLMDLPTAVLSEALRTGRVDFVVVAEPWLTRLQREGRAVVWNSPNDTLADFQISFLMYGPSLLTRNPDAGLRFMVAYLDAVEQFSQGKTERNLDILERHTGLSREILKQACWPAIRNDGRIDTKGILDFQEWALSTRLMDNTVKTDQFWEPRFINEAAEIRRKRP